MTNNSWSKLGNCNLECVDYENMLFGKACRLFGEDFTATKVGIAWQTTKGMLRFFQMDKSGDKFGRIRVLGR